MTSLVVRVVPALLLMVLGLAAASGAQGRTAGVSGAATVLRGEVVRDGEPVPGIEVTLHRVTQGASGAVGRETTDAAGRFRFDLPAVDSGSFNVFFTTADYLSVRYFGRAVHPADEVGEYTVEVFDTTSVLPQPIRLSRRDVVLVPQAGGGWEVDEYVQLRNVSRLTLVSSGGRPTVDLRIPEEAEDFEVGESEIPGEQIQRMGSRVLLMLPLTPGEREMYIRYRIPAASDRAVLEMQAPVDTFNLYIRQPSPRMEVTGLTSTNMVSVEDQQFLRYAGTRLDAGSIVGLEWESAAPPVDPVVAAVIVTVLLLGAGAVVAARGARPADDDVAGGGDSAPRELAARQAD